MDASGTYRLADGDDGSNRAPGRLEAVTVVTLAQTSPSPSDTTPAWDPSFGPEILLVPLVILIASVATAHNFKRARERENEANPYRDFVLAIVLVVFVTVSLIAGWIDWGEISARGIPMSIVIVGSYVLAAFTGWRALRARRSEDD